MEVIDDCTVFFFLDILLPHTLPPTVHSSRMGMDHHKWEMEPPSSTQTDLGVRKNTWTTGSRVTRLLPISLQKRGVLMGDTGSKNGIRVGLHGRPRQTKLDDRSPGKRELGGVENQREEEGMRHTKITRTWCILQVINKWIGGGIKLIIDRPSKWSDRHSNRNGTTKRGERKDMVCTDQSNDLPMVRTLSDRERHSHHQNVSVDPHCLEPNVTESSGNSSV